VRDIMTTPFAYVGPDSSIDDCMAIMTERRVRHLPVLNDDRELVGIISIGDVVKFQSKEQDVQIRFLTEYISS
jgi:CBS domain-containing protein